MHIDFQMQQQLNQQIKIADLEGMICHMIFYVPFHKESYHGNIIFDLRLSVHFTKHFTAKVTPALSAIGEAFVVHIFV